MPKYINADDIKNDIKTLWDWETVDGIKSSTVLKQVLSDIDNINEAVVRCGGCKYANKERLPQGSKWFASCDHFNTHSVEADDYCSYGEKRKGKVKRCFDVPKEVAEMLLSDTERREIE